MPRAKKTESTAADKAADPNKLVRQKAGTYRTADDRFEVRQAALGWFLIDATVTDELGQELTRGPFPTLAAVGDELPEARRTTIKSVPRPKTASKAKKTPAAKPRPEAPPPPSWIDRLPKAEAASVRRLIRALELEEIPDAEELVRGARGSNDPVVASRVLEKRLRDLVEDLPSGEQASAAQLVRRVAELFSAGGTKLFDPLPGWALVEVEAGAQPPARRIVVRGGPRKSR
jgi:hypothetical protein